MVCNLGYQVYFIILCFLNNEFNSHPTVIVTMSVWSLNKQTNKNLWISRKYPVNNGYAFNRKTMVFMVFAYTVLLDFCVVVWNLCK